MFTKNAARRTCDWLVLYGGIEDSKRSVYEFGLDKLYSTLVNFAIISVIGAMFGVFIQTVLLFTVYIVLRVYAGGYHAESPVTCFFVSILILIPCVVLIRFYHIWYGSTVFWSMLLICAATLILVGPVENTNKLLDSVEKRVYFCRMIRNLALVMGFGTTLWLFSQDSYAAAILCGVTLTSITAGVGKMVFAKKQTKVTK
ncbi:MAG: accessory gene regulator B family protein [Oscillospiraceae bacterium]|nr:accessory gene regulator B family protein [Oscillospiraceae bacterium]